ncbi:MAG: hypothetical protein HYT80_11135 [Euryarchaeota archaeon]|nr:hypothetical protein [Euryarchaeota archaeon]
MVARRAVLVALILVFSSAIAGCASPGSGGPSGTQATQALGGSRDPFQRDRPAKSVHFSHTAALTGGTSGVTGECGREGKGKDFDDVTWKAEPPASAPEDAAVEGMKAAFKILYETANLYKVNFRVLNPDGGVVYDGTSVGQGVGLGTNSGGSGLRAIAATEWGAYKFEVRICYSIQLRYNIEADIAYQ